MDTGKNQLLTLCCCLVSFLIFACQSSEQPKDNTSASNASIATSSNASNDTWTIGSPTNQIQLIIRNVAAEGQSRQLDYQVTFQDKVVIEPSVLGVKRKDQSFGQNLKFIDQSAVQRINSKATVLTGKRPYLTAQANESTLTFENPDGARIELIVRAYNNGIAFRYRFPETSSEQYTVVEELSTFDLPPGKAWMHPYDSVGKYQPAYETYFENNLTIGQQASGQFNGWAFPALFNVNNSQHWLLISESGLDGQYCGMHLNGTATNGRYQVALPLASEVDGQGSAEPSSSLPWTLPWRFVVIGNALNTIVESDMTKILAEDSKIEDVSWIKPGVSSWSWWSDSNSPRNYQSLKKFVDLSAEMRWPYTLVDANWDQMKGGDLKKLSSYAATKEVGLLVWYNSGGPHNTVTEAPRDQMHERQTRRATFKKLQDLGVKGVKVDFWHSDKQWMIQYYLDLLQDAADHQLLVNFHGCTLPRGWSRTYPNLMTMEAVRGGESYKFDSAFTNKAPQHNTILPFTRNVVGSMDYTPAAFSASEHPRLTTMAHELALAYIFESGVVHLVDEPKAYLKLPIESRLLLKYLPTTWDDTQFILGWPGKDVIIARRSKTLWYVAGINGENKTKTRKLNLRNLDTGLFEIEYIHDGPQPGTLTTEYRKIQSFSPLEVTLPPYGGFVLKIRKP